MKRSLQELQAGAMKLPDLKWLDVNPDKNGKSEVPLPAR
jgi:hypothetical protein